LKETYLQKNSFCAWRLIKIRHWCRFEYCSNTLNNPQFQPFVQCLLNELVVGLWNFELFLVNWILCFEVYFVLEILGETQVVLVNAESP
jgi:hypothetical protein